MGVLKKHQPVVKKKKSSRTKAQRKHRRQENQKRLYAMKRGERPRSLAVR